MIWHLCKDQDSQCWLRSFFSTSLSSRPKLHSTWDRHRHSLTPSRSTAMYHSTVYMLHIMHGFKCNFLHLSRVSSITMILLSMSESRPLRSDMVHEVPHTFSPHHVAQYTTATELVLGLRISHRIWEQATTLEGCRSVGRVDVDHLNNDDVCTAFIKLLRA